MAMGTKVALLALQAIQVVFILGHDWVPLGRFSNLAMVRASDTRAKLIGVTVLSALPFALPLGVCCWFGAGAGWPGWLVEWLSWTYWITLGAVVYAWYGPYLLWHNPERSERYRVRFAGTHRFLPERHGFAPDTLHVGYHACLVATVVLLYLLRKMSCLG